MDGKLHAPLPSRNAWIGSKLDASESSMLIIDPQHSRPAVQAHLFEESFRTTFIRLPQLRCGTFRATFWERL